MVFVFFGVLSLILSVTLLHFIETYPDTYFIQQERIKQMSTQRRWPKPKDLLKQFLDLMACLPWYWDFQFWTDICSGWISGLLS